MKNKNICYMIVGLGVGGAENIVIDLANHFAEYNQVTLVLLTNDISLKNKLSSKVKIKIFNLHTKRNILKLILFLSASKFDILHSHMYHSNLLSRIIFLTSPSTKIINSIHNSLEIKSVAKRRVVNFLYRLTDFAVHKMTNVSLQATNNVISAKITSCEKIETIYNGRDFEKFSTPGLPVRLEPQHSFKILTVASLTEQKAIENAIVAIAELIKGGSNLSYHIVGDGPLRLQLERLISSHNMNDRIFLHGVSQNVAGFMNNSDLFLLPSRWEGFGLVLLEAVACGLNVLATDCDGPREIFGSDYENLCVPDNIPSLTTKIKECYENNVVNYDRDKIIKHFDLSAMIEGYTQLYVK